MKDQTKLFKLLQITRSQPQYGYLTSGINKSEVSNLAEHHYLVTFISWQLAREAKRRGAKISIERVLEFSLTHDLGEMFGGDIAMPYAKKNPKARKAAKGFELENQRFLSKFFDKDKNHVRKLMEEILDAKSDEARLTKAADYLEILYYLSYVGKLNPDGIKLIKEKLKKLSSSVKDKVVAEVISDTTMITDKEFLTSTMDIWFE